METPNSRSLKLYSPGQIALAAFIGSPLAACWFWSRNFLRLGQPASSTKCLVWGVVGTAVLFIVSYFLPERFPNSAIPMGYTIGLFQVARGTHGSIVTQHLSQGGRLGSWWAVIGISLLFLVVIFAVLFGIVLLLPDEEHPLEGNA